MLELGGMKNELRVDFLVKSDKTRFFNDLKQEVNMNRKSIVKLIAATLIIVMIFALAACAPAAEQVGEEERELTIGIVTLQMRAPYFIDMVRAIEAAAAEYGNVRTIVVDAEGDVAAVDSAIEDLIAQRVDGLIMNISPIETLPGPMEAINEAGIPVVLVNRRFLGTGYDSWVGVDNLNTGAGVGAVIVETMGGSGNLLMIRGGPEDNHIGNARRDGVLSQVEPTDIEVILPLNSADGQKMADSALWRICWRNTRILTLSLLKTTRWH